MKKVLRLFNISVLLPLLFSCAPDPMKGYVNFLNEHDAHIYFCGTETNAFDRLDNFDYITPPNLPENIPDTVDFVIDVNNTRDIMTGAFLNKIYDAFAQSNNGYVMFINYSSNLIIAAGTQFADRMGSLMNLTGDMILFYRSTFTGFIGYVNCAFEEGEDNSHPHTLDKVYDYCIIRLYLELKNALREE